MQCTRAAKQAHVARHTVQCMHAASRTRVASTYSVSHTIGHPRGASDDNDGTRYCTHCTADRRTGLHGRRTAQHGTACTPYGRRTAWQARCMTLHGTALHGTALHPPARHCTALHGTALHGTARHCTALHGTAWHCTALHCTRTARQTARTSMAKASMDRLVCMAESCGVASTNLEQAVHALHAMQASMQHAFTVQ